MSLLDAAGVINGDIWCNGAFDFESPLKDLLDSGDYTLEQLLAEDELLQELRGVHPQLMDFFSTEEAVSGLVQYIILPPSSKPTIESDASEFQEKERHEAIAGGSDEKSHNMEGKEQQFRDRCDGRNTSSLESNDIRSQENSLITMSEQPGKWLKGGDPPEDPKNQEHISVLDENDDLHIRFSYMACEVICCEIKGVIDILVDGTVPSLCNDNGKENNGKNEGEKRQKSSSQLISHDARGKRILDLLFSILYESEAGDIDDYRAGYFEKVLSILFRYRPKDIAQYLNDGGGKGNVTLMSAMFKHLYSHSLMQIVQRLLLPQLPIQLTKSEGDESEGKGETNECEDLFNDTLEGTDIDPIDSFRCNWSESEVALQMVLECLIGENINKETPQIQDDDNEKERNLDLYQNSSEVLITIIQNSPLTSLTMRTLTTDPNLGKLISAATLIEEDSEFSRHDSRLTYAMNVLESLILQLGGYGSVGTMMYEGDGQGFESVMGELIPDDHEQSSNDSGGGNQSDLSKAGEKSYATPDTLIHHLPVMMSSLSNLLVYPGAENWISPMQFSKMKAQNILGSSRLRIVRLLESLVLLGNRKIDSLLCESSCLEVCLDLFWKFQWCSMLHQSVANLLVHAFEGQNSRSDLQSYFIVRCNLLGRLMYSFWDKEVEGNITSIITASNVELSESIVGHKDSDSENSPTLSSVVSEKEITTKNDVFPVSDDDVDAAIEQQEDAVSIPSLQATGQSKYSLENSIMENVSINVHDDANTLSSFRLGYMGHVIIICQALVHACTEEGEIDSPTVEDPNSLPGEVVGEHGQLQTHLVENKKQDSVKQSEHLLTDDCTSADDTPADSLILAHLVRKHPLGKIWHDFVLTTLASETAMQTTPLGGFQVSTLATDPLHMHRPGLEDDDTYDDDNGDAPTLPQRGLLVDGDVIDMDDNDLEVAANMMAGLNLGQGAGSHRDIQTQPNPSHQSGYIFDDPLGSGRFGEFDDDNDGDSSSDEESDMVESTSCSGSAKVDEISGENEAPVMDLFAGNFDAFDETAANQSSWSDFANFDDAFAGVQAVKENHENTEKNNYDEIFGDVKRHDMLLDDLDKPLSPDNDTISIDDPATDSVQTTSDKHEPA